MTAKATQAQAQQIIEALEPAERTAANRRFHELAGRVWTNQEIVDIARYADVMGGGYSFYRAAAVTARWIAEATTAWRDEESDVSTHLRETRDAV